MDQINYQPVQVTGYFVAHGQEMSCIVLQISVLTTRSLEPVPVLTASSVDEL